MRDKASKDRLPSTKGLWPSTDEPPMSRWSRISHGYITRDARDVIEMRDRSRRRDALFLFRRELV